MKSIALLLIVGLAVGSLVAAAERTAESALAEAGDNRAELTKLLATVPEAQREGVRFLIANMPPDDLRSLTADYLRENVTLAYEALAAAPWAAQIPTDLFLNDVLPYASLNERRDAWRARLREVAVPLVRESRTPTEAAQALNRGLFRTVQVRYSTKREKPDQSPLESMESGLASCSGLSILLVDACRAVGIPARVVGTPLWTNLSGNHTWVEVWDGGWHFLGAAEPDTNGLDRGWFKGNASKAVRDLPQHAIYASSFRQTGLAFPLVWDRRIAWVPAVNVTDRYTAAAAPVPDGKVRLLVRVLDREGRRVAAKVTVTDAADAALKLEGMSRDESADLNNILSFLVPAGRACQLRVEHAGQTLEREVVSNARDEQTVTVALER
ncbi:MAG: transglutaminase-like domain-containing protein [Chthoniobacter sp.]|nr:transglutaminase-like domain-containing protein [Chthoniobacter sp.]